MAENVIWNSLLIHVAYRVIMMVRCKAEAQKKSGQT